MPLDLYGLLVSDMSISKGDYTSTEKKGKLHWCSDTFDIIKVHPPGDTSQVCIIYRYLEWKSKVTDMIKMK